MAKSGVSETFEIVVVLAIVAIVAFTGQALIYFETQSSAQGSEDLISGNVVAEEATSGRDFSDISVERLDVNPQSPLIGDPFRVTVVLKNRGTVEINTPFYVEFSFEPRGESVSELEPIEVVEVMPQILAPGQETGISILVSTIVPEGPLRIVATADVSNKLDDHNTANNQLSKTIIVAVE